MLRKSKCPKCQQKVVKYVGMKEPVIGMEPEAVSDDAAGGNGLSWNVTEVEDLTTEAVSKGQVVVIHLKEDKVSPLVGKGSGIEDSTFWATVNAKKPLKSLEVMTLPNYRSSDPNLFSYYSHLLC
jgi:hypothetical protein